MQEWKKKRGRKVNMNQNQSFEGVMWIFEAWRIGLNDMSRKDANIYTFKKKEQLLLSERKLTWSQQQKWLPLTLLWCSKGLSLFQRVQMKNSRGFSSKNYASLNLRYLSRMVSLGWRTNQCLPIRYGVKLKICNQRQIACLKVLMNLSMYNMVRGLSTSYSLGEMQHVCGYLHQIRPLCEAKIWMCFHSVWRIFTWTLNQRRDA